MEILIVRHGDPDYERDSLTYKGIEEARLLAERLSKLEVTDFYCSPLGRAQKTASYTLDKTGRTESSSGRSPVLTAFSILSFSEKPPAGTDSPPTGLHSPITTPMTAGTK